MSAENFNKTDSKPSVYYQRHRREIEPFIPTDVRRVLDVGCGQGFFGEMLKSTREIEVWGVELDAVSAKEASRRLDRVLTGDVEQNLNSLSDGYFDCITFNDVLEHLVDPWNILRLIKSKLRPGGVVVSSIPNIRYFYALREVLVDRQWPYRGYGIFDKTHLRFFTYKSMIDLFNASGFDVVKIHGINGFDSWKFSMLSKLFLNKISDMRYEQFVVIASPN
jgi:methionine biosynthesis protein MetW